MNFINIHLCFILLKNQIFIDFIDKNVLPTPAQPDNKNILSLLFKNSKKEAGMDNSFIKPHTINRLTKNAMKVTTVKPNFGKDSISNVFNDETFKFESTSKENVKSIIVSENQIIEAIKLLSQNS